MKNLSIVLFAALLTCAIGCENESNVKIDVSEAESLYPQGEELEALERAGAEAAAAEAEAGE